MAELLEAKPKPRQRIVYPLAIWLKLRQDYVQGKANLEDCCSKHGVNYQTACTRAHHEKWTEHRRAWFNRAQSALELPEQPKEQIVPQPVQDSPSTKLEHVEAQLKAIDEALVNAGIKDLPSLWKAKSMALDAWSLLTGFERPGVRRRSSKRGSYQSVQPIEPIEPVPTQPAKPMGWEYEG